MNIVEAFDDPNLFEPWFRGATWDNWRAILKGVFALPMTDGEREFFYSVAEREPPTAPVREVWLIVGRRGGKDSVASVLAAHVAAMFDELSRLRPGERALVACLAVDRDQAKIVLNYTRSYFTEVDLLKGLVRRETETGFELTNSVDIAVATNSFRSVRGRPILCAILDETAFWRDESTANPDAEVYKALVPGLASLKSSILIGISSPYKKGGLLYEKFKKHYGRDDADVLVIKAPTSVLNPTIDPKIIAKALADDPEAARTEWLGEFRDDLADFIDADVVRACIEEGVRERPPVREHRYVGFVDPSGGSADSFTLAIAHKAGDTAVLDLVREIRPPFSPEAVVAEYATLLRRYRISRVGGDHYAGEWPREQFRKHGIYYQPADKSRSELYLALLPLINSRSCDLLDEPRLVHQLANLERRTARTGRDSIDHAPGSHDDIANAAAGALVRAWEMRSGASSFTSADMRQMPQVVMRRPRDDRSETAHGRRVITRPH